MHSAEVILLVRVYTKSSFNCLLNVFEREASFISTVKLLYFRGWSSSYRNTTRKPETTKKQMKLLSTWRLFHKAICLATSVLDYCTVHIECLQRSWNKHCFFCAEEIRLSVVYVFKPWGLVMISKCAKNEPNLVINIFNKTTENRKQIAIKLPLNAELPQPFSNS